MKCEECLKVIEEYFDGELAEHEASNLSAHLANCDSCARHLEGLHDERNFYALYRREVEVRPALWAGVAARIREAESARVVSPVARWQTRLASLFGTPRLSPALTFALLILAVGATAGLMKYMQSRTEVSGPQAISQRQPETNVALTAKENNSPPKSANDKEESAGENSGAQSAKQADRNEDRPAKVLAAADRAEIRRPVARPEGFTDEDSPDQLVREAEQKYRAAIALLSRDARRRRTLLEPDVLARFDQTLAGVDQTINETRRAVRRQPDDPVAVQYMLAAYAKKVEVLKEMATYRADDREIQ